MGKSSTSQMSGTGRSGCLTLLAAWRHWWQKRGLRWDIHMQRRQKMEEEAVERDGRSIYTMEQHLSDTEREDYKLRLALLLTTMSHLSRQLVSAVKILVTPVLSA
jgi:hypothetical protein